MNEKRWKQSRLAPYVLILPFSLLLLCLIIALVNGLVQSFGYIPGYEMTDFTTEYWVRALTDSQFLGEFWKSIWVSVVATLITAVLGILLGWCLVTVFKGRGVIYNITKLPMLIPYSVCALLIMFMVSQTGFIPRVLVALGFENASEWFSKVLYWPNSIGVILVFVFHAVSFFAYMIVGTMSQISDTIGEASMNLGMPRLGTFLHVTLPHCMPIIRTTAIFVFVIFFGSYEVPMLVGSSMEKMLSVQAYLDYINFNFTVYRPMTMVLNTVMMVTAGLVVLAIFLWDFFDRRKRGVM